MKKIIFILLLMIPINIFALSYGGCTYSEVSKMKESVKNVNISYEYRIENNSAIFSINLVNITPDIYAYDGNSGRDYYYSDTAGGEITLNNFTSDGAIYFYSNNPNCKDLKLGNIRYSFPKYNPYYNDPVCKGMSDFELCKKWTEMKYSYDEFKKIVIKEKNKSERHSSQYQSEETILDTLLDFYSKYYLYFLVGIIALCLIIIYIKKNQSKL